MGSVIRRTSGCMSRRLPIRSQAAPPVSAWPHTGEHDRISSGDNPTGDQISRQITMRRAVPCSARQLAAGAMPPPEVQGAHASGMVMKNRVISGCVSVTGPPRSICCFSMERRCPAAQQFPNRTTTNGAAALRGVADDESRSASTRPSGSRSDRLSVEIRTKRSTCAARALPRRLVPHTVLEIASSGSPPSTAHACEPPREARPRVASAEHTIQRSRPDVRDDRRQGHARERMAQLGGCLEDRILAVPQHIRRSGPAYAICRHSSNPIEPPPPVTRTLRPQESSSLERIVICARRRGRQCHLTQPVHATTP